VTQDATGAYVYRYTVHNLESSPQNLKWFTVRYDGADIYDIVRPGELWDFFPDVRRLGVPEPVVAWACGLRPNATEADVPGVPPGQSVSGFGFTSRQPPGVVTCYARGYVRGVSITDPSPERAGDPRPKMLGDCAVGTTIGPASATPRKLGEGYILLGYSNALSPDTTEVLARSGANTLRFVVGSHEVLVDGRPITLSRPTVADEAGHLAVSVDLLDLLGGAERLVP